MGEDEDVRATVRTVDVRDGLDDVLDRRDGGLEARTTRLRERGHGYRRVDEVRPPLKRRGAMETMTSPRDRPRDAARVISRGQAVVDHGQ